MGRDRAGGTSSSNASGNPPAIFYDLDETFIEELKLVSDQGFSDALSGQTAYILEHIGTEYLLPYLAAAKRMAHQHDISPTVKMAHDLFILDRRFQAIIFKYIGLVEMRVKALYAHYIKLEHGPMAHHDSSLFLDRTNYDSAMESYEREVSRKVRIRNSRAWRIARDNGGKLPIDVGVAHISLGTLSKLFSNTADNKITGPVSRKFGASKKVLSNWLRALTGTRNAMAHFEPYITRRQIPVTPMRIIGVDCDNHSPFYIVPLVLRLLERDYPFDDLNLVYNVNMRLEVAELLDGLFEPKESIVGIIGAPVNWKEVMDAAAIGRALFGETE